MMRVSIPVLALTVLLAACDNKEAADDKRASSGMSAEAITGNDVTAIDAVTGEAANMAADVDLNEDMANALENVAEGSLDKRAPASGSVKKKPAPAPAADTVPESEPGTANTN